MDCYPTDLRFGLGKSSIIFYLCYSKIASVCLIIFLYANKNNPVNQSTGINSAGNIFNDLVSFIPKIDKPELKIKIPPTIDISVINAFVKNGSKDWTHIVPTNPPIAKLTMNNTGYSGKHPLIE